MSDAPPELPRMTTASAHGDVVEGRLQGEPGTAAPVAGVPPEEAEAQRGQVRSQVVLGEVNLVVGGDDRHPWHRSEGVVVQALTGVTAGAFGTEVRGVA
jgi:hypothetical protein